MLKKKFRLSMVKRMHGARTINSPLFVLKFCENGEKLSRFAFIISKKIDKRAVVRNKIKRSISRGLEKVVNDIDKGYDFIFIVKKQILDKDQQEIPNIVEDFLKQNKFLK